MTMTQIALAYLVYIIKKRFRVSNNCKEVSYTGNDCLKKVPLLQNKYSVKRRGSSQAGKRQSNVSTHLTAVKSTQLVSAINASTTFPMCSLRLRSATAREISISPICQHNHWAPCQNINIMNLAWKYTCVYLQSAPRLPSLLLLWRVLFLWKWSIEYCDDHLTTDMYLMVVIKQCFTFPVLPFVLWIFCLQSRTWPSKTHQHESHLLQWYEMKCARALASPIKMWWRDKWTLRVHLANRLISPLLKHHTIKRYDGVLILCF